MEGRDGWRGRRRVELECCVIVLGISFLLSFFLCCLLHTYILACISKDFYGLFRWEERCLGTGTGPEQGNLAFGYYA